MTAKKWKSLDRKSGCTEFQTPPIVCNYMAAMIPEWCKTVFEPTPGIGNLVRAVPDRFKVTAADDFFSFDRKARFDCVIMNPPFSELSAFNIPADISKKGLRLGYHIMQECMSMSDNVIALMPWYIITDSDVRARSIYRYGLKSVTHLPRSTFAYTRIQVCVMELEKGWKAGTQYKVFECISDEGQNKLFQ